MQTDSSLHVPYHFYILVTFTFLLSLLHPAVSLLHHVATYDTPGLSGVNFVGKQSKEKSLIKIGLYILQVIMHSPLMNTKDGNKSPGSAAILIPSI